MSSTPLKPLSIQLYTLRAEAAKDFPGVLKRLAEIGYKGVEPAGFFNFTPKDLRAYVEDLGMVISSTHSPWARPDNLDEVIEISGVLGVKMVAGGWGAKEFETLDAIKKTAEITAGMNEKLEAAGLTLVIHNHAWEFEKIDGRIKHEIFAELCPKVKFELDTYWAANFGENDAPEMVRRFAKRSPLLHIKDGPMIRPQSTYNAATSTLEVAKGPSASLLPVGAGKNDIHGIIRAMDPAVTEWLVVEQDNSDTDMFECVEASYRYLTSEGLGAGNK
jgi:sugar phosphate isomerase/epimerase